MESDADLVAATAAAGGTFSAALIRKSWPEITNRCTPECQSRAFLAAIAKFTP